MNRPIVTATLVFAVLALPAVGDAQIAGSNNRAPIAYGADAVEYVGGTLTLNGRAELIQGDNRLRANRISGFNNTGGESRMEATGDVFFVTPEQTIRGDRAVYTTADGVIVVTGDVILTQGQNVATGSRLTYNVRTESARFDSGANGRVQGVFYPDQTGN